MDLQAVQPLLIAVAVANEYLGSRARLYFGGHELYLYTCGEPVLPKKDLCAAALSQNSLVALKNVR